MRWTFVNEMFYQLTIYQYINLIYSAGDNVLNLLLEEPNKICELKCESLIWWFLFFSKVTVCIMELGMHTYIRLLWR